MAALPVAAAQPDSRVFADWIAACDNLASCQALSLPRSPAESGVSLKLDRDGGPGGGARLSLRLRGETKGPREARLILDGAPVPAQGRGLVVTVIDEDSAIIRLPRREGAALLATLGKATTLALQRGGETAAISLAGLAEAWLWIDEQQGRLDTTGALIRKGRKPAGTVPAAPKLPSVTARPTAALPAAERKAATMLTTELRQHLAGADPQACEDASAAAAETDAVWPLDAGRRLVGLTCGRGAYSHVTGFWIVPRRGVAEARRAILPQPRGGSDNRLAEAAYEPAMGRLSFLGKARGAGDCGTGGAYAWTGTGFALTAYRAMGACRGLTPDDWLTLWRSAVTLAK